MKKLILIYFILFSGLVHAWRLSPMVQNFGTEGKSATKTFLVTNDGKDSISLEVVATTRSISIDGKEERKESQHFLVYPPQLTLKAGERRSLRVSYMGPKGNDREMPYRLIVRQLPVNAEKNVKKKKGAQIDFMFEYIASLYVDKEGAKASLSLDKSEVKDKSIELTFSNSGSKHVLLRDYDFFTGSGKEKVSLSKKVITPLMGVNILPGEKRMVQIPKPKELSKSVKIQFSKKK